MGRNNLILVCLTTVIFTISLVFFPINMVAHLSVLGVPTRVVNKYMLFIAFTCINIVGSIFWSLLVEKTQFLNLIPLIQVKLKTYFSFLMLLLLLAILTSSISSFFPIFFLLGGHILYVAYLFVSV